MQPITLRFIPVRNAGWKLVLAAATVACGGMALMSILTPVAAQLPSAAAPASAPATKPGDITPTPVKDVGDLELADANKALAEKFATATYQLLQAGENARDLSAWRQASALLDAACRLDPDEPQYPRLRSMALEQVGDRAGSIRALIDYLDANRRKGNDEDDTARLKVIEYYASQEQTNEGKLSYYRQLLDKPSVSKEIKSRCATWAAATLLERSHDEAVAMMNQALALDPLNIYACRMEFELVAKYGTPGERVRSLFAQLRCNPAQTTVLASIGREFAAQGMVRESARWYDAAAQISMHSNIPMISSFFVEYASQLFLNGEFQLADQITAKVIEGDPSNLDAWFLRLTIRKAGGQSVALDQDLDLSKRVFASRAGILAKRILEPDARMGPASRPGVAATQPTTNPSTQPIDFGGALASSGIGDRTPAAAPAETAAPNEARLTLVIQKLAAPDANAFLKKEFTDAIIDLAWYEIYYDRSEPAAIIWVDAAKKLLGEKSETVIRFDGWLELLRHHDAAAMKILWPLRETDALSGVGVVELLSQGNWAPPAAPGVKPATKPAEYDANVVLQKLLDRYPRGLTGALLSVAFKSRGGVGAAAAAKLYPTPGLASESLRQEQQTFPTDLINVVDHPANFYIPIGQSRTEGPYHMGEPMYARLRIQNNSNYDLPMGPDGVIKPDLWFDGRVSLAQDKFFPMCGTDKICGPLVLKAHASTLQMVRVDQGALAAAMRERPAASINCFMTVMTNPLITPDFRAIAGPCGVRRQFTDTLIRAGMPIQTEPQRKALFNLMAGLPSGKMRAIDIMMGYIRQAGGPDSEPKSLALRPEMVEQVGRAENDRIPQVGAWATINSMRMVDPADVARRSGMARTLAKSPMWECRLVAILAARQLEPKEAQALAKSLAGDPNPIVQEAARAEAELCMRRPVAPAPRPAAGPATSPATPPVIVPPNAVGPATGPAIPTGPALPSVPPR